MTSQELSPELNGSEIKKKKKKMADIFYCPSRKTPGMAAHIQPKRLKVLSSANYWFYRPKISPLNK
jgi:hypothetical protein